MVDPGRQLGWVYLSFLGPMVAANGLQALSGTLNGIFIGQMLGTQALAAVAGMFPVVFVFVSLIIGVGAGASVLIGQAWGARESHKVKRIAGAALALGAVIGVAAALAGSLFTEPMLRALGTPVELLPDAVRYARVLMLTMPLLLVFVLYTQLLRGVGDTMTPLYALLLSTGIGMALTPAFIKGWIGLPRLGIVSAALAGLISFAVALGFLAWYLLRRRHPLAPDRQLLRALRLHRVTLVAVLRIGLPTGIQTVVVSLAGLAVLGLVNRYGAAATAAYGAVTQVTNYVQFPALSVAITASVLGAQAIGAGRSDRLGAVLATGLWISAAVTGALVALGYGLSEWLLGMFLTDRQVLLLAERLLHITLWSSLLFGFQAVISGIMRAGGTVLIPVAISIASIAFVQLPAAYFLSARFGLPGVWMAFPVVFAVMLVLQAVYYGLVWRHKKIERLV